MLINNMAIDLSILKSYRRSLDSVTKAKLLEGKNLNLLNTDEDPIYLSKLQSPKTDVYYENSHIVPMDIIQNINNYRFSWLATMLIEEKGMSMTDAIKTIYSSKLYKKLKVESTKMWHLGPVALFQELSEELRQEE